MKHPFATIASFAMFCAASFCSHTSKAQDLKTSNQFIFAEVDPDAGFVTFLLPPGHIGFEKQLSFQNKSYFTCKIGNTYFTNNQVIAPFPGTAKRLTGGTTAKIRDTIRTIWANKNGVDIIQDVYPVAFERSGQIVLKWKILNHNGAPIGSQCQYLLDVQITDPTVPAPKPNSNDGPTILTRWGYKPTWQQWPNGNEYVPNYYVGFLFTIPNAPSFDPDLSAQGWLDNPSLGLTKPFRLTIGDWFTLSQKIFGVYNSWPVNNGTNYGTGNQQDNAVLLEFPPINIDDGKEQQIGRTSYGTGEYEICKGNLFALAFYPHRLKWAATPFPGKYQPNPFSVDVFAFNTDQANPSSNTKLTCTVGRNLTIYSDSLADSIVGKVQTQPIIGNGLYIPPDDFKFFQWWAVASPATLCTGDISSSLIFTGTCGICPPAFIRTDGADTCEHDIILECAETDLDAPLSRVHSGIDTFNMRIDVFDNRPTDKGLQSITWLPSSKKDSLVASNFVIKLISSIKACYNDKDTHTVTILQIDRNIGACFDFTFTDCLGHQSYTTVCMPRIPIDSFPPRFSNGSGANDYEKKIEVIEDRTNDRGMKLISWIPINGTDTSKFRVSYSPSLFPCDKDVILHKVMIAQLDSTIQGCFTFRFEDCAGNTSVDTICMSSHQVLSVSDGEIPIFSLESNHPNPFARFTTFNYRIAERGIVRLDLYDELGRKLASLVDAPKDPGAYSVEFDGSKLASGSYIVRLESNGKVLSGRVTIER